MGWEREASDHTVCSATDGNPVRRGGAEPARKDEGTGRQRVWEPEVVECGAPGSGGSRQDRPSGPEIRKGNTAEMPAGPGGGACPAVGSNR